MSSEVTCSQCGTHDHGESPCRDTWDSSLKIILFSSERRRCMKCHAYMSRNTEKRQCYEWYCHRCDTFYCDTCLISSIEHYDARAFEGELFDIEIKKRFTKPWFNTQVCSSAHLLRRFFFDTVLKTRRNHSLFETIVLSFPMTILFFLMVTLIFFVCMLCAPFHGQLNGPYTLIDTISRPKIRD